MTTYQDTLTSTSQHEVIPQHSSTTSDSGSGRFNRHLSSSTKRTYHANVRFARRSAESLAAHPSSATSPSLETWTRLLCQDQGRYTTSPHRRDTAYSHSSCSIPGGTSRNSSGPIRLDRRSCRYPPGHLQTCSLYIKHHYFNHHELQQRDNRIGNLR